MKKTLYITILILLLLPSACAPAPAGQPVAAQTLAAPSLAPTYTPAWTSTPTAPATPTTTAVPTRTAGPTNTPTVTLTATLLAMGTANPTLVPESRRYTDQTASFSLVPPADWTHTYFKLEGIETDGWFPAAADPARLNLGVLVFNKSFDLDQLKQDWAANLEQKAPDYTQIRADHLVTGDSLGYLRWELTYTFQSQPQRLVYAFYRTETITLALIYLRPTGEGSEYDLLADETFKTVRLLR